MQSLMGLPSEEAVCGGSKDVGIVVYCRGFGVRIKSHICSIFDIELFCIPSFHISIQVQCTHFAALGGNAL